MGAKMRYKARKVGSILCAASCLISLSGCLSLPKTKTYTYDEISEELRKDISVTDWDGPVPDGMEARYVMTRKVYKDDSGNGHDIRYEYDDKGRQIAEISVEEKSSTRSSLVYNDDGMPARKDYKTTGKVTGYHINDYEVTYEYNDNAQLVSCTRVSYNDEGEERQRDDTVYEYENGHLVRAGENTYDYNDDAAPYYEYVALVNDSHFSGDVKIVKRFYDENGLLISEEYDQTVTDFEYENGVLTGKKETNRKGICTRMDADGRYLSNTDPDGILNWRYKYNEYGDQVCYEEWKNGKARVRNDSSYVYDENGNRLSLEKKFWSVKEDGTESSFKSTETYEYDEHGLLLCAVTEIDGRFTRMEVYSYGAVLIPAAS